MKLFDCHCHVHLGPNGIAPLLKSIPLSSLHHEHNDSYSSSHNPTPNTATYAGAAIMSTHPRDYPAVDSVVSKLRELSYRAVPCYGIHPWFLHEVLDDDVDEEWLVELKQRLIANPDSIVGEIGLDGARWREAEEEHAYSGDSDKEESIWKRKRVLSCPMDYQKRAFEQQLLLAAELQRPVSIHVVRAWGELFDSLGTVRDTMKQRYAVKDKATQDDDSMENETSIRPKKKKAKRRLLLPPIIYFHAFSGKAGVLPSILAACEKGNVPREDVFFGFAPAIPNFYSPKTPSIMKQIGIHQLVLETDLEDASNAWDDLKRGVEGLALALDMDDSEVAEQTYQNAVRLYSENFEETTATNI